MQVGADSRAQETSDVPDSLSKLSMRPSRFSSPSMYLALATVVSSACAHRIPLRRGHHIPLGRVSLFLHLGEDAVGLVVDAVCAGGELAVALDLLLPAHVTGLQSRSASAILVPMEKKGQAAISQLTLAILLLLASWESSSRPWSPNICPTPRSGPS